MTDLPKGEAGELLGEGASPRRWPAEWEPHRATWLSWPHNKETWPAHLGQVEDAFCEMVRAIVPGEVVEINVVDPQMADHVRARLSGAGVTEFDRIRFREIPTDDAWVRDHGGIFVAELEAIHVAELIADNESDIESVEGSDARAIDGRSDGSECMRKPR